MLFLRPPVSDVMLCKVDAWRYSIMKQQFVEELG
jgi:hypothetical protein